MYLSTITGEKLWPKFPSTYKTRIWHRQIFGQMPLGKKGATRQVSGGRGVRINLHGN